MLFCKKLLFVGVLLGSCGLTCGAPELLQEVPLESPGETYSANVEWDDAGFIGRIRMLIYTRGEKPTSMVELPQIKPLPANLSWITNDWVACESFVAERGAAFFYMHVPREKGYMIEIFAPEAEGDWLVSYTTNDSVSTDTINTLSRGHSSLFPILLRDLPEDGLSYMSPDFPFLLADAVDSFTAWRKAQKFTEMKFLTGMAENPNLGRLVVASMDDKAEIIYFPQGTTTTREMLALTQRQPLPDSVQKIVHGIDPPELDIKWTGDAGQFAVSGRWDDGTTVTELVAGKFEGVSDSVYTGPGVKGLLQSTSKGKGDAETDSTEKESSKEKESSEEKKAATSKKSSKSSTKSSSKSSSKSSKKPSRSK